MEKDLLQFNYSLSKICFICEIIPNSVNTLPVQLKHILIYKQKFKGTSLLTC